MSNQVQNATLVSSITNTTIGNSPTDLMAYVETLLIQDYNDQMKDMANDIKRNTRLKQAYREHKIKVNDLLRKEQKDGKVELTGAEYNFLKSEPDFRFEGSLNGGSGGVVTYNKNGNPLNPLPNDNYMAVQYRGNNIVAANQTAEWHGDPHFNDADSVQTGFGHSDWDFQGVAGQPYNYLQDSNLKMSATHQAWGENGATVVGSVDIALMGPGGTSNISYNANGSPTLNGQIMKQNTTYQTSDGGWARYNGQALEVHTAEGYNITLTDRGNYFDGQVTTGPKGVMSDGIPPTGIIGSQFDADAAVGQIEGDKHAIGAGGGNQQAQKISVDEIKSEIERLQMRLDGLNSETELAQTELGTVTSQRKLAFESLSTMISKVFEGASSVVRNIK